MATVVLRFCESAVHDLEDIKSWYDDRGVPGIGGQFVSAIFGRLQDLLTHPDIGRMVPEFGQPFLRELIHPPFRIVYRREPQCVQVVRVLRSERLLKLPPEG